MLLRGGNQGFEQRGVVVEVLRMPLHAEVEAPRWVLQTLDQTVAADRAHLQRVGHAGDRLVVHRVHQQRMRRRRDALPARFERCGPSRLAAWYHALARAVAQHPVQHAARRDVDTLDTTS